jgi:hypothetical protein
MSLMEAFGRSRQVEVKPGECYRRAHGGITETVTVLDLKTDPVGIPHVRFRVQFERTTSDHTETAFRMLALGAFRSVYRDRLA